MCSVDDIKLLRTELNVNDSSFVKYLLKYLIIKLLKTHRPCQNPCKFCSGWFWKVNLCWKLNFLNRYQVTKISNSNMTRMYLSKNKKYPGGRLNKIKKKPKPKNKFDIIGTLLSEKSMTGQNLTRQIFSYLDISSLFRVQMVSKTWRQNLDYGNIGCGVSSLG